MIPRTIHYIWLGDAPLPARFQRYIKGWQKLMPDWEIIRWNETNFDIANSSDYCREAYAVQQWAFVSDYMRVRILYEYGGIYLDTDEEVLQSLEPFLQHDAFFGLEPKNRVQAGVFGCIKGHPVVGHMLESFNRQHFILPDGTYNLDVIGVTRIDPALRFMYGYEPDERKIDYLNEGRVAVYPSRYFCPDLMHVSHNADNYTIHWPAGSWLSPQEQLKKKAYVFLTKVKPLNWLYRKVKR